MGIEKSQVVVTSRQEMLRLTLATLALLIAGLLATPAMETSSSLSPAPKMAQQDESLETKLEKPGKAKASKKRSGNRSMAQMNWRR